MCINYDKIQTNHVLIMSLSRFEFKQVKLMALYRGLHLCIEHNVSRVWIEMDAQIVVQMIQGDLKGSYKIRYLLESIRKYLQVM